jgi:hypothetical protein
VGAGSGSGHCRTIAFYSAPRNAAFFVMLFVWTVLARACCVHVAIAAVARCMAEFQTAEKIEFRFDHKRQACACWLSARIQAEIRAWQHR